MTDHVWYAAYGSNMHSERLRYYLEGGRPPGGLRTYPGCRDSRPPRRAQAIMIPGGIYFALESKAWTGGMAFFDPKLPGQAACRAYLITASQFADIAAQEMYAAPGTDLESINDAVAHGRVHLGPGRYETLVCAGSRDDHPILTFTAPWEAADVALNPPSPRYLTMIATGLHEAHGWSVDEVVTYLAPLPGVKDWWARTKLTAVVTDGLDRYASGLPEPMLLSENDGVRPC